MSIQTIKPNYFRIKEAILVSYYVVLGISATEYKPEAIDGWAKYILNGVLSIQYVPVEVIRDVLELAMTCTSEETQTYSFMQIGDSQMEEIMIKHDCN